MSSRLYVIAVLAGLSVAHARAADNSGYLIQAHNGSPITTSFGECVHTGAWSPASSYRQCDAAPVSIAAETAAVEAPSAVLFRMSMDTLFDFDSAVLKADAGPRLDELAGQINQARYQKIDIVGHADRIGPAKYNQRLSEERARAVREYLAGRGIDESRIAITGVGSSEPVTGSECERLRGKRLVSCLGPDRHAEVTVIGTQTSAMR